MKLYDYYRSTASYRVRLALAIKNISYEKIPIHLLNNGGEQYHPNYLSLNPQGLVPTLEENHQLFTQSLAIIEYLEETHPEPALLPSAPVERALVRSIALLVACDIHPLNCLRVINFLKSEFKTPEEQIMTWYHHWLKLGFDALETRLQTLTKGSPFCYGAKPSLADICLIPQVYNAERFNFPMENYPRISAINTHCLSLAAFQSAKP